MLLGARARARALLLAAACVSADGLHLDALHLRTRPSTSLPARASRATSMRPSTALRVTTIRLGVSADRSPSHGALYEGWGESSRGVLNHTCTLLDEADERGMNRYELAKV